MAVFAHADIIRCISLHFYRQKPELKSTRSRTHPSTSSASLKKIHLFLWSLFEGQFLFYFSVLSFIS